jgi:hypothetical protein
MLSRRWGLRQADRRVTITFVRTARFRSMGRQCDPGDALAISTVRERENNHPSHDRGLIARRRSGPIGSNMD